MSSRVITDDELMAVVLYDIENIIVRYRRLFNHLCDSIPSYYDLKEYVNAQRLFGAIESYCALALYHDYNQNHFDFVFKDFCYAYINSDEDAYDEINRLLFKTNVWMKWLEARYLRFYNCRVSFSEDTNDVPVIIDQLVEKTMEVVKDKNKARGLKTITEKLEELDYLLSGV